MNAEPIRRAVQPEVDAARRLAPAQRLADPHRPGRGDPRAAPCTSGWRSGARCCARPGSSGRAAPPGHRGRRRRRRPRASRATTPAAPASRAIGPSGPTPPSASGTPGAGAPAVEPGRRRSRPPSGRPGPTQVAQPDPSTPIAGEAQVAVDERPGRGDVHQVRRHQGEGDRLDDPDALQVATERREDQAAGRCSRRWPGGRRTVRRQDRPAGCPSPPAVRDDRRASSSSREG